jgi:ribosomal protein L28
LWSALFEERRAQVAESVRNNKLKYIEIMSKICQITGKKAMVGNNVSHSNRKTKRRFDVNLFTKKFFWPEEGCWIVLKLSASGLRLINKIGLDAAIRQAAEKGYLSEIKVK